MTNEVKFFDNRQRYLLFVTTTNEKAIISEKLSHLISELKPLIQEIGDATLIVPLIKEYLEIGVKNDEQLIKMATIIQRAVNNTNDEGEFGITEEEKAELLAEMDKLERLNKENKNNG